MLAQPKVWAGWSVTLRLVAYALGTGMIALAVASYLTELDPGAVFNALEKAFGTVFLLIFGALVLGASYALTRLAGSRGPFWNEVGLQCAGGTATLALTFTLLGISLGIGSLADQTINADSIEPIVQELTRHFSTAFLTTVVGLPTANLLRAATVLRYRHLQQPGAALPSSNLESGL